MWIIDRQDSLACLVLSHNYIIWFDAVLNREPIFNINFKQFFLYEAIFCHFHEASEYHYYGQQCTRR